MQQDENKAKILIVDDEKVNIDVLVGLLRPHYKVVAAKDGEQALKRLEKSPLPDLILLDVVMPGMDGYTLCQKIKENMATRMIPIIFITGQRGDEDEIKGLTAGAVDYITKPVRPMITLARIKNHLEMKRRGDMLEQLAIQDGLTGIANRRRFDQFLAIEWERSIRYQHPLSLILMDIDYFKLYNDHYGHAEGDECLTAVAGAIENAMPRPMDLAARYGGEEFACILPETDADGALAVANRILAAVRELGIIHATSRVADHITMSMGISTVVPTTQESATNMVEMADRALYRSKHRGRNCISHYQQMGELLE